jgi:hypothetical protein
MGDGAVSGNRSQSKFLKSQLLRATQLVISAGGDPNGLPYCFWKGSLVDYSTARAAISASSIVLVPLTLEYSTSFKVQTYPALSVTFFELPMKEQVFVLGGEEERIFDEEVSRRIAKEGRRQIALSDVRSSRGPSLSQFLAVLRELWKGEPLPSVEGEQLFTAELHSPPPPRWVLVLRRPS